jgi:hypothetical protein
LAKTLHKTAIYAFGLGLTAARMTELLQQNVSSVTRGAIDEDGVADAVVVPGLVKSAVVVVVPAVGRQRDQYRGLGRAVSLL